MRTSFLAHVVSGTLLLAVTILFIYEFFYKREELNNLNIIYILLGLSIAYGIHELSHILQEVNYDFDPLANWF